MIEQNDKNCGRRQFLARAGKAGVSIAAAGLISYLLYDKYGPATGVDAQSLVTLPDFRVPDKLGQTISIIEGSDRKATVNKAIESLGGIERFVKQGETVAIKPNVAFASSPMLGATAHPELVAEVVRLCYKAGAKQVIVTDNPINDPASCFKSSGIGKAAGAAGAKVVLPKAHLFRHTTLEGGKLIRNWPVFFGPFEKVDKLIGISPAATMSVLAIRVFARFKSEIEPPVGPFVIITSVPSNITNVGFTIIGSSAMMVLIS